MLELLHRAPDHDALQLVRQTRVGSCPWQAAGSTKKCQAMRIGLYCSPPRRAAGITYRTAAWLFVADSTRLGSGSVQ